MILKWVLISEREGVGCGLKHFKIGTSEGLLYTVLILVLQYETDSGLDRVTAGGKDGTGLTE